MRGEMFKGGVGGNFYAFLLSAGIRR